jgi:hypothetical protein
VRAPLRPVIASTYPPRRISFDRDSVSIRRCSGPMGHRVQGGVSTLMILRRERLGAYPGAYRRQIIVRQVQTPGLSSPRPGDCSSQVRALDALCPRWTSRSRTRVSVQGRSHHRFAFEKFTRTSTLFGNQWSSGRDTSLRGSILFIAINSCHRFGRERSGWILREQARTYRATVNGHIP